MAKGKDPPPLTPRAREVLVHVINAVALGTHGDEGEVGVIAERLGTTPGRLGTIMRRMDGWVTGSSTRRWRRCAGRILQ